MNVRSGVAAALAVLAACSGETRTLSVTLVTAPGSTVLDDAVRARVTLTSPRTVVEGERTADGFALDLEVPADGGAGVLLFEAFDAEGDVVAVGQSPAFPVAAIAADIAIYVAAPMSLAASPAVLSPARRELAVGPLAYGAIVAGGIDASGAASSELSIYNAYSHALQVGEPMPSARSELSLMVGTAGYAYLFGGRDGSGAVSGVAWRFDTRSAPDGEYVQLVDEPSQARAGAAAAPLGLERFLILGSAPLVLDGLGGSLGVVEEPAMLGGQAVSIEAVAPGEATASIFTAIVGDGAGATGVVRLRGADFTDVTAPASALRTGHVLLDMGDGTLLAIGGEVAGEPVADAVRVDPVAGSAEAEADVLITPRRGAAIARVGAYVVVAGGRDAGGALVADAEVLDAASLAPVATIPMVVPRTGARAQALPSGQVMIIGGTDAADAPIATIELFTPPVDAGP
jgi:hypothetical protein